MNQFCHLSALIYIFCNLIIFVFGQGIRIRTLHYVNYTFGPNYLQIKSTTLSYNFRIRIEKSIFTSATKVFLHQNNAIYIYHLRNTEVFQFYRGYGIENNEAEIFGFVKRKTFTGTITMDNEIYFVAPSVPGAHFTKEKYSQNVGILYNMKDFMITSKYADGKLNCDKRRRKNPLKMNFFNDYNKFDFMPKEFITKEKTRKIEQQICSLELVVDHTYFEYMDRKRDYIITEILYYMKIVDMVFRNIDINEDGSTDHIRFIVEKITIFSSKDEPGYPFGNVSDNHNDFIDKLTTYVHPYCMMICFCHRDFWKEEDCAVARVKKIGGLCPTDSKQSKPLRSHNVGFVTTMEKNFSIIVYRIIGNLLHQLGHVFGCMDDPLTDKVCSPGNIYGGNFIMHPKITYGSYPNNWKFSPCSIKSMREFLQNKEINKCLTRAVNANCGDGITEEGEVCDCDMSSGNCTDMKKCCTLEKSTYHCLLRDKSACYPVPGQCCENCKISKGNRCFGNIACFNRSTFCDGVSPFCPREMEPDGTPCLEDTGNCIKGQCQSDICKYYNLTQCECETLDTECHKCCRNKQGKCLTVKELEIFPSETKFYRRKPGSLCNNDNGICVSNGTCITQTIVKTYSIWYFLVLLFFVLFFISAYICYRIVQKRRKKKRLDEIKKVRSSKSVR